ncbi:hypothetical protein PpBr36_07284 [Pyricularia pennisetigena]|uniref:hypothetical protein n=1 Tax=Pyricularia pennisetigena TaxID=1578925 RepID=UPI00114D6A73|nr:hypothetical protein PpBr36_07284 [Pyricularia pennisetigena]TLS25700.1 hypothetical protein PpBr36_07284 [Pyricularia pennisetigena]
MANNYYQQANGLPNGAQYWSPENQAVYQHLQQQQQQPSGSQGQQGLPRNAQPQEQEHTQLQFGLGLTGQQQQQQQPPPQQQQPHQPISQGPPVPAQVHAQDQQTQPTATDATQSSKRGRGRPRGTSTRQPAGVRKSRAKKTTTAASTSTTAAPGPGSTALLATASAAIAAGPAPPLLPANPANPRPPARRFATIVTPTPRDEDLGPRPPNLDDPVYQELLKMQDRFYIDHERCLEALLDVALKLGFGVVIKRSKREDTKEGEPPGRVYRYDMECTAGKVRAKALGVRTVARKDCPWTAQIISEKKNGNLWQFKLVEPMHNHAPFPDAAAIPVHRRQTLKKVEHAVRLLGKQEGTTIKDILDFVKTQYPDRPLKPEDIKNFFAKEKKKAEGGTVDLNSEYAGESGVAAENGGGD